MKMTSLIFIIICLAASGSYAQAENKFSSEKMAYLETMSMSRYLQLDSTQFKKIAKLNEDFHTSINANKQTKGRKEFIDLQQQKRTNTLKQILTKEQFARYQLKIESLRQEIEKKVMTQKNKSYRLSGSKQIDSLNTHH